MTATALALPDICLDCVDDLGLCRKDGCRKSVLPQLAKPSLVKYQGETRTEQTKRQTKIDRSLPVSPEAKAHKARVKSARSIARSKRRGLYGLLKTIKEAK